MYLYLYIILLTSLIIMTLEGGQLTPLTPTWIHPWCKYINIHMYVHIYLHQGWIQVGVKGVNWPPSRVIIIREVKRMMYKYNYMYVTIYLFHYAYPFNNYRVYSYCNFIFAVHCGVHIMNVYIQGTYVRMYITVYSYVFSDLISLEIINFTGWSM